MMGKESHGRTFQESGVWAERCGRRPDPQANGANGVGEPRSQDRRGVMVEGQARGRTLGWFATGSGMRAVRAGQGKGVNHYRHPQIDPRGAPVPLPDPGHA